MAEQGKTKFQNNLQNNLQNNQGAKTIQLGIKAFSCIGASEPHDHPHIYLDMGKDENIICPYCSTVYEYRRDLSPTETNPPDCLIAKANK